MKTPILDEFIEELQELKDGNFSLTKDLEERLIEFKNIKAAINYTHSCTELKDKKAIPFDDWTRVKGMKLLIDSNYRWDKTHVYKEVVHKMYEVYLINL